MTVPLLDCAEFSIKSHTISCPPTTFTGGRGLGGFKQTTRTENRYWRGSLTLNRIFNKDLLKYRAFMSSLAGASGVFDLCLCDPFGFSFTNSSYEDWLKFQGYDLASLCGPDINGIYGLPFSDGTCFSDGTGFLIPPFTPPTSASLSAVGSSTILLSEGVYEVGMRFSTPNNYLHEVISLNGSTAEIVPPLREEIQLGDALNFSDPLIRVRLSSDTSGQPRVFHGKMTGEIGIDFEEVLER